METTKKKILVVDDSKDLSAALHDMLTLKGYEVTVIHNGVDAIDTAFELRPDLVLLDIHMHGIDGYEVIRQFQKDVRSLPIKVLVLTASEDGVEEIPPDIALLPEDYLLKSKWSMEDIADKIREKLSL